MGATELARFSERNWKRPRIPRGRATKYGWTVSHPKRFRLGKFTDLGYGTYIQSEAGVVIEDHVQIGGGVKIYSVDTINGTRGKVIIRRNAMVGANSVILPGVEIGENSLVGALSLVRAGTIIPPGELWAGVPARRRERSYDKTRRHQRRRLHTRADPILGRQVLQGWQD